MFRQILLTQWKSARSLVLVATLAAFAMPLVSLRLARDSYNAEGFVATMQMWGSLYSLVAAGAGLLLAIGAWRYDHQGRHVYALSLPIERWRYAAMRFAAGALFLVPVAVALLAAAIVVAMSDRIPEGLHAYPLALALRFTFAAGIAYAIFFAIASATARTSGVVLGVMVAFAFAQYALTLFSVRYDLLEHTLSWIFVEPGLLSVFTGTWMLVDV